MARIQSSTMTPDGWFADVYQGKQDGDEVFLAVALFTGRVRTGASYVDAYEAMAELDDIIKLLDSEEHKRENPMPEDDTRDLQARYDQLREDYDSVEEEWEDAVAEREAEIERLEEVIREVEDNDTAEDYKWDFNESQAMLEDCEGEAEDLREQVSQLSSDLMGAEDRIADLEFESERKDRVPASESIW